MGACRELEVREQAPIERHHESEEVRERNDTINAASSMSRLPSSCQSHMMEDISRSFSSVA